MDGPEYTPVGAAAGKPSSRPTRTGAFGQRGVAVLMVLACLAVLMPFTASYNYQARVDWQSAVNLRDEVAARNLQRGALRLSLLLFELQRLVFNAKQFRDMVGSMDITQVAPYLMSVFGTKDGGEGMGDLLGIDTTAFKDLSIENGTFEVRVDAESGRINVNCLAKEESNNDNPQARGVETLEALMLPVLYDSLFEEEKSDGQRYRREDVVQAIVDYVDENRRRFDPVRLTASSAAEVYRYEQLYDNYEARNAPLDSIEELHLVQGIDDDWMLAFGSELTVYGGCKVNLNFASADQIALVIRHAVAQEDRYKTEGDNFMLKTMPLANFIVQQRTFHLFGKVDEFKEMVKSPDKFLNPLMFMGGGGVVRQGSTMSRIPEGMALRVKSGTREDGTRWGGISDIATVAPERVYRIEVITEVNAVKKRVSAVYDMQSPRAQSQGKGAWLYYRED